MKRCSIPKCDGWYIDTSGQINFCTRCRRFLNSEGGFATYLQTLIKRGKHDTLSDGWDLFWTDYGPMIQRCDETDLLGDDDVATILAVGYFNTVTGCNVGPREKRKAQDPDAFEVKADAKEEAGYFTGAAKCAEDAARLHLISALASRASGDHEEFHRRLGRAASAYARAAHLFDLGAADFLAQSTRKTATYLDSLLT